MASTGTWRGSAAATPFSDPAPISACGVPPFTSVKCKSISYSDCCSVLVAIRLHNGEPPEDMWRMDWSPHAAVALSLVVCFLATSFRQCGDDDSTPVTLWLQSLIARRLWDAADVVSIGSLSAFTGYVRFRSCVVIEDGSDSSIAILTFRSCRHVTHRVCKNG